MWYKPLILTLTGAAVVWIWISYRKAARQPHGGSKTPPRDFDANAARILGGASGDSHDLPGWGRFVYVYAPIGFVFVVAFLILTMSGDPWATGGDSKGLFHGHEDIGQSCLSGSSASRDGGSAVFGAAAILLAVLLVRRR